MKNVDLPDLGIPALLRKFGDSLGESQDKPGSHSPEAKDFVDRIKQFFKDLKK